MKIINKVTKTVINKICQRGNRCEEETDGWVLKITEISNKDNIKYYFMPRVNLNKEWVLACVTNLLETKIRVVEIIMSPHEIIERILKENELKLSSTFTLYPTKFYKVYYIVKREKGQELIQSIWAERWHLYGDEFRKKRVDCIQNSENAFRVIGEPLDDEWKKYILPLDQKPKYWVSEEKDNGEWGLYIGTSIPPNIRVIQIWKNFDDI